MAGAYCHGWEVIKGMDTFTNQLDYLNSALKTVRELNASRQA